jgi:hypothetical protein
MTKAKKKIDTGKKTQKEKEDSKNKRKRKHSIHSLKTTALDWLYTILQKFQDK